MAYLLFTENLLPYFVKCVEEGNTDVGQIACSALLALVYNSQKVHVCYEMCCIIDAMNSVE